MGTCKVSTKIVNSILKLRRRVSPVFLRAAAQVFLDAVENVNLLVNSNGNVVLSEVGMDS